MGGHDEREQTLNQLLAELDGFDPTDGVVLLPPPTDRRSSTRRCCAPAASTGRCWSTGRTSPGGSRFWRSTARRCSWPSTSSSSQVAAMTTGFTGADLANLVNEAALLATRREAIRSRWPTSPTRSSASWPASRSATGCSTRGEREIVAYHEMGHALVAMALPGTDPVHKVSIVPRGVGALGYTIQRPTDDRFLMTGTNSRSRWPASWAGAPRRGSSLPTPRRGGRRLGPVTDIARGIVTRYGMDEQLGSVAYVADRGRFLQPSPGEFHRPRLQRGDGTRDRRGGEAIVERLRAHAGILRAIAPCSSGAPATSWSARRSTRASSAASPPISGGTRARRRQRRTPWRRSRGEDDPAPLRGSPAEARRR